MARTSRAEKARTRRRLVAAASRELRERGVAGTSIPGVMERIGLTQGTFYSHFASKDALLAEAVGAGLAEMIEQLLGSPAGAAPARDLDAIIARYLDPRHRDDPVGGCMIPALAGEVRRESGAVQRGFTGEFERFLARLAPLLPARQAETRTDQALALIAGLAGAILLARAVDDPALSDRILRACREHYTGTFGSSTDNGPFPASDHAGDVDAPDLSGNGGQGSTAGSGLARKKRVSGIGAAREGERGDGTES